MDRKSIEKQFLKYVVPSMFTMLLTGFYTIVDGFFIGRAIGDVGLAAINIAWPITAVMLAVGTGIGTGGSVLMSTHRGEDNYPAACRAKGNTVSLLVLASLLLTALFIFTYPPLLRVLGAAGQVYTAASEYVFVIICGAALQIFGTGFTPLLRNSRKTITAMVIMVVGLITNIVLDWWFIMGLQMGMRGAALATITAQGLVAVFSFIALCRESDPRLHFKPSHFVLRLALCGRILQTAVSPFGLSLPLHHFDFQQPAMPGLWRQAAVAAYSVSSYLVESVTLFLSGIGEGIQPLISYFNGAKEYDSMNAIKQKGLRLALCISAALSCVLILVRNLVPVAFGTSPEASALMAHALVWSAVAFPFIAVAKLFSSYFYAVGEARLALFMIYADPCCFTPLLLFVLPLLFAIDGIWIALPGAQALLVLSLFRLYGIHKKHLRMEQTAYANATPSLAGKSVGESAAAAD
ncbi:MAG: MATE family efflux transporter [Christensenellales bacterium]